jgi:glycosyltransferase involved in cell wall biosynthesis
MRVAFFTHYESLYGANRSMLNLIEGLLQKGVNVLVVSAEQGAVTEKLDQMGVEYFISPFYPGMNRGPKTPGFKARVKYYRDNLWRLRKNLKLLFPLYKKLNEWQPDILYSNSSVISIGIYLALLLRKPHVWHFREFGDLDFDFSPDLGEKVFNYLRKKSDAIICISDAVKNHYPLVGLPVYVIYNGIASEAVFNILYKQKQQRVSNTKKNQNFVLVGRLNEKKGQEIAIKAFKTVVEKYPDAHLFIVGGGDKTKLVDLVKHLSLEKYISFLGFVNEPFAAFDMADTSLMCSTNEAMGRVTVESMAALKPVIGYDAYGTSELIEHEKTGLLYKDGPEDLAEQMIRLIENPDLANKLAANAWKEAKQKYSIEHYTDQVYSVLESVLNKGKDHVHS